MTEISYEGAKIAGLESEVLRLTAEVKRLQDGITNVNNVGVSWRRRAEAAEDVCENLERRTWAPPDICELLKAWRAVKDG